MPIGLHGDGVATSGIGKAWQRSVEAFSWTSLLARGPSFITNYVIYLVHWVFCVHGGNISAYDAFMRELSWSLYWLFVGKFPTRDVQGRPFPPNTIDRNRAGTDLADGYFAVVWALKGDLEHVAKWYKFPYATEIAPCALCACNSSDIPWTDGRLDFAERTRHIWRNDAWAHSRLDRRILFREIPGLGIEDFYPDWMHCAHLGAFQYFYGGVLQYLVYKRMPGNAQDNMALIWREISEDYKAT